MVTKRGIVSLTYDGTQLCHVETALPELTERNLQATFYAEPSTLLDHYPAWRTAQTRGHEIGNGSLIGAALPDGSLPAWTTAMILDDLAEANDLLFDLFPDQSQFSLGLPYGKATCADSRNYLPSLQFTFRAIRSGTPGINPISPQTSKNLKIIDPTDLSGSQLIQIARQAIQNPNWIVFAFDGIGVGKKSIDHKAHRTLLDFLVTNQDILATAPVIQVTEQLTQTPSSQLI